MGELLLRLQLRSSSQTAKEPSVLVLKRCSFNPGNDSQHSKELVIYIHHKKGNSRSTVKVPAEFKAIQ